MGNVNTATTSRTFLALIRDRSGRRLVTFILAGIVILIYLASFKVLLIVFLGGFLAGLYYLVNNYIPNRRRNKVISEFIYKWREKHKDKQSVNLNEEIGFCQLFFNDSINLINSINRFDSSSLNKDKSSKLIKEILKLEIQDIDISNRKILVHCILDDKEAALLVSPNRIIIKDTLVVLLDIVSNLYFASALEYENNEIENDTLSTKFVNKSINNIYDELNFDIFTENNKCWLSIVYTKSDKRIKYASGNAIISEWQERYDYKKEQINCISKNITNCEIYTTLNRWIFDMSSEKGINIYLKRFDFKSELNSIIIDFDYSNFLFDEEKKAFPKIKTKFIQELSHTFPELFNICRRCLSIEVLQVIINVHKPVQDIVEGSMHDIVILSLRLDRDEFNSCIKNGLSSDEVIEQRYLKGQRVEPFKPNQSENNLNLENSYRNLLESLPFEFENKIGRLLSHLGYSVEVTQKTGDGGIDIRAMKKDVLNRGLYIVQCKRFNPSNLVGVQAIRDLYGVTIAEDALKGILITTSDFTKEAKEFAFGKRLELISGSKLKNLLEKLDNKRDLNF